MDTADEQEFSNKQEGHSETTRLDSSTDSTVQDEEIQEVLDTIIGPEDERLLVTASNTEVAFPEAQVNDVLNRCLEHLLTSPETSEFRNSFLPNPGSEITLLDGSVSSWPTTFAPKVQGFKFHKDKKIVSTLPSDLPGGALSIRLDSGISHNSKSDATNGKISLVFEKDVKSDYEGVVFCYSFRVMNDKIDIELLWARNP